MHVYRLSGWGEHLVVHKELSMQLPYDPAILLLGMYPREIKTAIQTNVCTKMFTTALSNSQKMETTQMSINKW